MSNQEIIDFTHERLASTPIGAQDSIKVVKELVKHSERQSNLKFQKSDNISAVLIPLTRGIIPIN